MYAKCSAGSASGSRNTVASYHRWARQHGLLTGELPDPATLATLLQPPERAQPGPDQSSVAPFREQVVAWRQQGVEGQAIFQLLVEQHGFTGSYSAVKRFLRRLEPPTPQATIRGNPGRSTVITVVSLRPGGGR
jgi:hypothetical protein